MDKFDCLKLENQLCFPLYAASKEVIKKYQPFLDELNLTYTQYITMIILWENSKLTVKELGSKLLLDSGTLTPLLKKLEKKEYIKRERSNKDERNLIITITDKGKKLRKKAITIPENISKCIKLNEEDALKLYELLYKILYNLKEGE